MVHTLSCDQLKILEYTPDVIEDEQPEEDVFVFPLSFAQERLWFLDQFEPDSPFYNIPAAVHLSGRLDVVALEQTLNEIVRRHESLRTTFGTMDGKPIQIISPSLTLNLPIVDLRDLPEDEREAEAMRLANEEAKRPFNLSRGPLLRVTLLRLDEEEYLVLLTMHHIISDGWSIGVFIGELTTLYKAFSCGKPSPLPELPIQYADFAHWQREWLRGEVLEAQLDYWKRHLDGDLGILELPTDRPRPAVYTNRGGTQSLKLTRHLTEALKAISRQERGTLFMTLLAAFQTLLHRYTGQDNINVGSPIASRNRAEIEGLIGFFVNTLVLRTDFSGDPTFRELLGRIREVTLEAYAHQDLPFEMLVDALQPERDMSHTPLFQAMFILQNAPVKGQELPGLTLSQVDVHSGTSTFDLTLSVSEEAGGLGAAVEYNTDLFNAATIMRMLGHFQTLLEGIVTNPDQRISQLPLLTEYERRQLLVEWNDAVAEYAHRQALCVHQLFEARVEETPDVVAVVVPSLNLEPREHLTYRELDRRANQLAHYLRKLDVGPGTVVGLCVERSLEMIVGVLGILKAGGAYLPLDPLYPQERLAFMLEDSQMPVLLTEEALVAGLPRHRAHTVYLDAHWEVIAQESGGAPANRTTPDDLVYMIYTSGSTGQSKGVTIRHHSLVNAYLAWERAYQLRSVSSHLQMANFAFDVFSGDLVRALGSGGKLVLCPREWLLAPQSLYGLMRQEEIDCAEFVPVVLRHLIQYLGERGHRLDFMRVLACGSDSWYIGEYRKFLRFCGPETRLINSFGLTEATIDSCYFENTNLDLSADQMVPIGRPFANTRLYILDVHLQPVPIGVTGELYVGGHGVALGYHKRPDMTAERFVPDPFSDVPGVRLYKTGDLARYLPDGNIELIGRLDYQVKIRGFRIEPGEIEAVLGGHPAVQEAAVVALNVGPGDERLAAYFVPAQSPGPTGAEPPTGGRLRRFLQERLPDYMVPSAFVQLEALPLTPNGKVDRQALPTPEWSRGELEGEYVAPRTPVEEVLAGIWTQVLSVEEVGIYDNFFELGGHSLLATQLVSRVREAFEIELPLRNVFEAPTVATLAEHVEIAKRTQAGVQAPPIRPTPRKGDLPLSFAQQRLWFLDQLEPNSPFYNIPESVRLIGPLDVATLEKGLNEIIRRHENLRTTFETVDGRPTQVIAPELIIPLRIVDVQHLPRAEREAEALRLAQQEAQRPFDLTRGPLLRVRLLRLGEEDHIVLLTMHHIIGDDWSTNVLIHEIAVLYDAFSQGRPSPLPELPIQYADFAHWQRNWLQGAVLETQLTYWRQQLADLPPLLELPTDRPRPSVQTYRGHYKSFILPESLSESIKALCQQESVTLFMTLMAAFQALLYRYSGQDDISIGTPIANRNRAEIEGLIGFFVNTLVLRTDLSGDPSFRELLKRVREVALGAYAHQDLPFEMIVDAVQPERNLSHSPLFQVMFALQNTPMQVQVIPGSGLALSPVEAHSGTAKFDLTLFMLEEGKQLSGALEYNTDLFDAATIERMLAHFEILLEGVVADPNQCISALPLLIEAERQQMLVEWNATTAPYPQDQCVHKLFEAQVERTPDATAVTFEEKHLTYAELNRRANQLAHHLQKHGVGPETLVGICTARSLEMVVGLLGVLKSGGAYVPIDPTYPLERLAFMVEDAQAPVLLTQEHLEADLPMAGAKIICLDTGWEAIAQESGMNPLSRATPENLAYVIYTSGSTGVPKGAMILHQGLVNYLTWCQRAYPVAAGRGAPVHSSISFDLTITGLFAPLLAGRRVQILPEDIGVETLNTALRQERDYSLVKITPAHLELLSQQLSPREAGGRTRSFIIGGENLLAESITFWQDYSPDTALVNEYGPTETVVGCCVYQVPEGERRSGSVPIGRAIINTQLYILDVHLRPVPIGVSGELYIGGAGVARGYLNRPELTAERFIPNPFSHKPGDHLYKTGDLARYLPDGNIEFLGRVDHQVKIRGFRIELGEIEAVLSQHPAVGEVVVVARDAEPEPGHKRLVAYVVPEEGLAPGISDSPTGDRPLSGDRLRDFLQDRLPEYMVPSAFVTLESLPLTPNGKVDRRALPAPELNRSDFETIYVAPRTPEEEILAEIWAEVLGVDQVGAHDNFFELGGDSILCIQVIARANQAGLRLAPRQVFEAPTVAGLAAVAGKGRAVQAEQGVVEGPVLLTPIQHWFFEQDLPEPHHWNQALLLQVRQPLEPSLLETAVGHLLEHHDALRLRFEQRASGWEQVNAGIDGDVPFERVELSGLSEGEQGAAIETRAAEVQSSLNLAVGPLLRVAYFDLGAGRPGRLLIVVHHLAVDGISWRILLEDLQLAYEQLWQGEPVRLLPKTTSFKHWARRLVEYAQLETMQEELDYWLSALQGPLTHLPVDYPGGVNTEASSNSVTVSLSIEETQALLQEVPAAYHTEINDALLTALAQTIGRWTGGSSLLVNLEGHGREDIIEDVDLSRTVGWFTTLIPVRLDLAGAHGPGGALTTVKEQLRRIPMRGFGYGLLRYLNQDEEITRRLENLPQAELCFNYLGQVDRALPGESPFELAPESRGPDRSLRGKRCHLLEIDGGIAGGQLQLEWSYSQNLHQRATIEKLARDFIVALQEIITHCQSPEAGGYITSDFAEFGWDQQDLEDILAAISMPG